MLDPSEDLMFTASCLIFFAFVITVVFTLPFCFQQTIAVIQAGHGLLQLGSCKIVSFHFHSSLSICSLSSSHD